jgi:hypothetical protein
MSFDFLFGRWTWRAIPNCPGRYVLQGAPADLSPEALLDGAAGLRELSSPLARDRVLVAEFEGGGLICYARPDGTYCHTLNTRDGFLRKLAQLGLREAEGS